MYKKIKEFRLHDFLQQSVSCLLVTYNLFSISIAIIFQLACLLYIWYYENKSP